jgi:hypothetical protein
VNTEEQQPQGTETEGETRGRGRRVLHATWRTFVWLVIIIAAWAFASLLVPSLPSPAAAARATLALLNSAADRVYMNFEQDRLEEAARKVRSEAVEHSPAFDTASSDAERLSDAQRSRLPMLPVPEDSTLRAELQTLSRTPPIGGRLIHVLIIGIDSRLSVRDARADALHLVTINPDSAVVEIMSIPRDTYCDLGYPDTTTFNIIANAKTSDNGLLMHKVEQVTKRGPVKYYVEVGFSQAMGILEMLGYRDPVSTLKFLRTRRTLAGGDIQRAHNQALFMRQNLIDRFPLLTGVSGDLLISAGLNFVTTNLTRDFVLGLTYNLKQRGFPDHRPDAVRLRMLPGNNIRLKEMTADSVTVHRTLERIERRLGNHQSDDVDVTAYLRRVLAGAVRDSARPGKIIYRLRRLHEQHAWLQIQDAKTRDHIRDSLCTMLENAYMAVGKPDEAVNVANAREAEEYLLRNRMVGKPGQ